MNGRSITFYRDPKEPERLIDVDSYSYREDLNYEKALFELRNPTICKKGFDFAIQYIKKKWKLPELAIQKIKEERPHQNLTSKVSLSELKCVCYSIP